MARGSGGPLARGQVAPSNAALAVRARTALVELIPRSHAPIDTAAPARCVVLVGDVRVEVGDDFDVATPRRLVGTLRTC